MRTVILRRVSLEGFKSFVQPQVVDLPTAAGMTMVAGDNRVDVRLGANGAGKSTLFDAVCFCLYGTGVRGARINDLVSRGSKKAFVTCEFDVDGTVVDVSRSGPPSRVYIDGEQSEQAEVDRLVGLTKRQFLNSVVYGQAMPLFIDLSIPERGELLDEVLDLELWMRASDRAAVRHKKCTIEVNELRVAMGRTEGAIASLEPESEIQSRIDAWEVDRQARIQVAEQQAGVKQDELRVEITELTNKCETWSAERDKYVAGLIAQIDVLSTMLDVQPRLVDPEVDLEALAAGVEQWNEVQIAVVSRLAADGQEKNQADLDINFLMTNETCPTCGQSIMPEFSEGHIDELITKRDKLIAELEENYEVLEEVKIATGEAKQALAAAQKQVSHYEKAKAAQDAERAGWQKEIEKLLRQVEREEEVVNPYEVAVGAKEKQLEMVWTNFLREVEGYDALENPHVVVLERVQKTRQDLDVRLAGEKQQLEKVTGVLEALQFWREGFKRVRLFCINRVLQQLDIETMNEAQALGLVGWKINYSTETETKSGTAKLGVQVAVKSPTMEGNFVSWSGGEGQRIRLCTALGFGSLLQRWSGVRWGMEVFDEPTAWLSEDGIEDLLELLRHRADKNDKSVFLADHRGLQHAGITRVMTVVKGENGSYVQ